MSQLTTTLSALLCGASLLAAGPVFSDDHAGPEVTVTHLKGELHLLQGRGGNVVASVGDDGVLIIDDDYTEYAPAHDEALDELAGSDVAPRFVLNTHWHSDHTGGNEYWGERGAVIVAHNNVYQRMSTRQEMKVFDRVLEPSPRAALPVVTYDDSLALRFNGETIESQHYPRGHTDGDSVVFFLRENVVHMGDHMFNGGFPFVDIGSGGTVMGYLNNVKSVLARIDDDTVVVPGHGAVANRQDLVSYVDMLEATIGHISERLEAGDSADEVVEQGLGEQWAAYGQGFIDEESWIRTVATSLTQ